MLDDYKYSIRRTVAYRHTDPEHEGSAYGPGGAERTYGTVTGIRLVEDEGSAYWEYTIRNSFTREVRQVREEDIFHGADCEYLDLHRRDDIRWSQVLPEDAGRNAWRHTLRQFVRGSIPRIREREEQEEKARSEGRNLELGPGDYIRIRGNLRPDLEPHHNLYAKILTVKPPDREYIDVPKGRRGITPGRHKVQALYHVLLDTGEEADIYDVEVKNVYTLRGREVILNWRAATFLAEAFGDHPPYSLQLEYLNGHVFTRDELAGIGVADLAALLARLLYSKGLIASSELPEKEEQFAGSRSEYLVDQILAHSRFDMEKNRQLTPDEIHESRSEDDRLRDLLG